MLQLFIAGVVVLGLACVGAYVYCRREKRKRRIALLTDGVDLLAHWTYSPVEWRRAVEEEFSWASSKDHVGQVYISPASVYVKADRDHLIDLSENGKVVTHASYRGEADSPLKLRVRWRIVTYNPDGPDQIKYYKEDYRIPVPPSAKEAARKVADFFTTQLENNLEAYTAVVSDDESISLFGKDSF
jgi:hypothetical protein